MAPVVKHKFFSFENALHAFIIFSTISVCVTSTKVVEYTHYVNRGPLTLHLLREKRAAISANESSDTNITTETTSASYPSTTFRTSTVPASTAPSTTKSTATSSTSAPTKSPMTTLRPTTENILKNATIVEGQHGYYSSKVLSGPKETQVYFAFFDNLLGTAGRVTHLYKKSRLAVQIPIKFDFLFYGHTVQKITIATGGFLYMSHFLHIYLTYAQYIAPLMGDFTTSVHNTTEIVYLDTGNMFLVQWRNLTLAHNQTVGTFTFQAALLKNGTIIFAYEKIPVIPIKMNTSYHSVKVGMSDAYYVDNILSNNHYLRRIYEYHSVKLDQRLIKENTVIILTPYPTCVEQKTCRDCVTKKIGFNCTWCEALQRCSSGTDRLKQNWENSKCHLQKGVPNCNKMNQGVIVAIVFVVLVVVAILIGITLWCYYAYTHPTTPSGIWLMEHRPSAMRSRMANSGSAHFFRNDANKYEVSLNEGTTDA